MELLLRIWVVLKLDLGNWALVVFAFQRSPMAARVVVPVVGQEALGMAILEAEVKAVLVGVTGPSYNGKILRVFFFFLVVCALVCFCFSILRFCSLYVLFGYILLVQLKQIDPPLFFVPFLTARIISQQHKTYALRWAEIKMQSAFT